jgi:2-dehydro-3-deoxy-D-gluconate 5-dehydrogenase
VKLFNLSGKVAIVTGGNGGIGLGMAEGLADCGATIVVAARDAEKSESALAKLRAAGARASFVSVDITQKADCENMVAQAEAAFGRLDILVNNAGIMARSQPQDFAEEVWRDVLNTNLTGAFLCCQAAYPAMRRAGGGKIINLGSMASVFGSPMLAAYASSKGGIVQLTRALATAWAKDNIQVNAVLPGFIDTDITRQGRAQMPGLQERIEQRTPAGRWGEPEDLAGIAAFLAAPASNFITGTVTAVDGGYSVMM